MPSPTKSEALTRLRDDHREVRDLVDRLSPADAVRPGLGGGEWSPKDLLGHLTTWEEYALAAMGAWLDGLTAPVDQALSTDGLTAVNRQAVAMKADRPFEQIRREFSDVHEQLVQTLELVPDELWDAPPTTRAKRSLGEKVGAILGGRGGPYRHAAAHLPDLEAFVADLTRDR